MVPMSSNGGAACAVFASSKWGLECLLGVGAEEKFS